MDDGVGVRRREDVEQLAGDREDRGGVEAALVGVLRGLHRHALEELHDEERRPVLRRVVVEDRDRSWMVDGVGDVPLAEEALPQVLPRR